MEPDLKTTILAILAEAPDMAIATLREDGYPQATTVSFASEGLILYFGCGPRSQKARNLARDDRVSITITLPYAAWSEIRGLSLGGRARPLRDQAEVARAGAAMLAKFPMLDGFSDIEAGETALFAVRPEVISVLDYRKGFGHTDLVVVDRSVLA